MKLRKMVASLLVVLNLCTTMMSNSYALEIIDLPAPGQSVIMSPAFDLPCLDGLAVHADNPFLFDFLVDRGSQKIDPPELKKQGEKLVKFFLASMTIPDRDAWVNLSPNERERIIPDVLSTTDMGQVMLSQDYVLKQLAASLTSPETELGKKYWDEIRRTGSVDEFGHSIAGKVWITSGGATVVEKNGFAFITSSHLKVMMENDNPAFSKKQSDQNSDSKVKIFQKIILPQLEKEVNEGKNFSPIRQVYQSVILATWYKKALKESLLGRIYADQAKTEGVNTVDTHFKDKVYSQYLDALRRGAYNIIKEEPQADTDELVPQKYFSGGVTRLGGEILVASDLSSVADVGRIIEGKRAASSAIIMSTQLVEALDEQRAILASSALMDVKLTQKGRRLFDNDKSQEDMAQRVLKNMFRIAMLSLNAPVLIYPESFGKNIDVMPSDVDRILDRLGFSRFSAGAAVGMYYDDGQGNALSGNEIRARLAKQGFIDLDRTSDVRLASAGVVAPEAVLAKMSSSPVQLSQTQSIAGGQQIRIEGLSDNENIIVHIGQHSLILDVRGSSVNVSLAGLFLKRFVLPTQGAWSVPFNHDVLVTTDPIPPLTSKAIMLKGLNEYPRLREDLGMSIIPKLTLNVGRKYVEVGKGHISRQKVNFSISIKNQGSDDLNITYQSASTAIDSKFSKLEQNVLILLSKRLGNKYLEQLEVAGVENPTAFVLVTYGRLLVENPSLENDATKLLDTVVEEIKALLPESVKQENTDSQEVSESRDRTPAALTTPIVVKRALASRLILNGVTIPVEQFLSERNISDADIVRLVQLALEADLKAIPDTRAAFEQVIKQIIDFDMTTQQEMVSTPAGLDGNAPMFVLKVLKTLSVRSDAEILSLLLERGVTNPVIIQMFKDNLSRLPSQNPAQAVRLTAEQIFYTHFLDKQAVLSASSPYASEETFMEVMLGAQPIKVDTKIFAIEYQGSFQDRFEDFHRDIAALVRYVEGRSQGGTVKEVVYSQPYETRNMIFQKGTGVLIIPRQIVLMKMAMSSIQSKASQLVVTDIDAPVVAGSPVSPSEVGGIDFDPSKLNLQIKRDTRGVPLPLPQQNLQEIHIKGLYPMIINIQPLTTVPAMIGYRANSDSGIDVSQS